MPVYITPDGYQQLVGEFDRLLKEERPTVTAEVAYAASLGDRSENAEYIYGKKRLRAIDKRLRYLKSRLDKIEVVDPSEMTGPTIRFGAIVETKEESAGAVTYTVVGEDEVDLECGRISYASPIGKALVGRNEGEKVQVKTPGGIRFLKIVSVNYPPRAEP